MLTKQALLKKEINKNTYWFLKSIGFFIFYITDFVLISDLLRLINITKK